MMKARNGDVVLACSAVRLIALLAECYTEESLKKQHAFQIPSQNLYQVIEFDVLSLDSYYKSRDKMIRRLQ